MSFKCKTVVLFIFSRFIKEFKWAERHFGKFGATDFRRLPHISQNRHLTGKGDMIINNHPLEQAWDP